MTDIDTDAVAVRADKAWGEVGRLCVDGDWRMHVPPRPDRDSDELIGASLADITDLLEALAERDATIERVEAERDRYKAAVEAVQALLADGRPFTGQIQRAIASALGAE